MAAYNRDIHQVMAWSMPQLRLLARYRDARERNERRWQLTLASGSMSQEAAETLWAQLDGDDVQFVSSGGQTGEATGSRSASHAVDAQGNVRSPGAPLLSDIALGKAVAPRMIPIKITQKSALKEEDA